MSKKCFACGRKLGRNPALADTRDDQLVFVGSECLKQIGADGWQPPQGGPRLYQLPKPPFTRDMEKLIDLANLNN